MSAATRWQLPLPPEKASRVELREALLAKQSDPLLARFYAERARALAIQKESGRRKGPGSRKGAKGARDPRKRKWIRTIRPIREELKKLREDEKISVSLYRTYYRKAKGGSFRSRAHLISHLRTDGHLKEE